MAVRGGLVRVRSRAGPNESPPVLSKATSRLHYAELGCNTIGMQHAPFLSPNVCFDTPFC
jgi:hypothetical protein